MPKLTVEGHGTFDVPEGKKLVLCIEDAGIPILHRCGGVPACTTCRVQVREGDVPPMSDEEESALEDPELIATHRLSCQIRVQSDLEVAVWGTVGNEARGAFFTDGKVFDSAGERPAD
ncbi:2Fe-2S iron-sulfur cluster-binding protein [Armatimonas sp.]|uniref:2Fe-2S iron-sulfur cluster-binding protein n=1 Tax=Armatimonas sp. TaxID=1872638 RepID=UPI0037535A03